MLYNYEWFFTISGIFYKNMCNAISMVEKESWMSIDYALTDWWVWERE